MRRYRVALVLLLSAIWLTCHVGVALPVALPFHDDFENIPVGYYPNANGWRTWSSGYSAYVSNQVFHSPNRSFRLHSRFSWSRCDYLPLAVIPDRLAYRLSLYMDPMPGREAYAGLVHLANFQAAFCDYFTFFSQDGEVGSVQFTGGWDLPPVWVGEFPIGQWVTVGAVLDYSAGAAELWLDDEPVATSIPLQPRRPDDPVTGPVTPNAFAVAEGNWPGGGWGAIYLDDVELFEPAPAVTATVDLQPDTLKLSSRGRWVSCHVELPPGYSVVEVDVGSLLLNDVLPPAPKPVTIGDYDGDGVSDLMVKFDRAQLCDMLAPGLQVVDLTGQLTDGTLLSGTDQVRALP